MSSASKPSTCISRTARCDAATIKGGGLRCLTLILDCLFEKGLCRLHVAPGAAAEHLLHTPVFDRAAATYRSDRHLDARPGNVQ